MCIIINRYIGDFLFSNNSNLRQESPPSGNRKRRAYDRYAHLLGIPLSWSGVPLSWLEGYPVLVGGYPYPGQGYPYLGRRGTPVLAGGYP